MSQSLFTTHEFKIKANFNQTIYLIPFGDIHRFARLCDVQGWLNFLKWSKEQLEKSKDIYFLGMGDYDDFGSDSERFAFQSAKLHDETKEAIDEVNEKRVQKMADELLFMRDRVIGMHEGNHHWLFPSGMTNGMILARVLNAKYLGGAAMIRLSIELPSNKKYKVDIFTAHGYGGGRTHGADLSTVEKMGLTAEADIYLSGHSHRKWACLLNKLVLTRSGTHVRTKTKKILLARTGTFLEAYRNGEKSYVVPMALPPTDRGVVKIMLTPKRNFWTENGKEKDEVHIDIHASI